MTEADHVMIALLVLSALLILWVAALCWWANEDRLELVDQ